MPHVRPSELELQVLAVLWDKGPSSVRAVLEAMPDGKDRAYTTILSVMQGLEKKGLVGHTQQGQANVYHALKPRGQVLRPMMKDLLRNVFGGSPARAVQCLLDGAALGDDELAKIRTGDPGRGGQGRPKGRRRTMNVFDVFGQPAWRHLVFALLHTLWQGGLIALATATALRRLPARRQGARYLIVPGRAIRGPARGAVDLGRARLRTAASPVETRREASGGDGERPPASTARPSRVRRPGLRHRRPSGRTGCRSWRSGGWRGWR